VVINIKVGDLDNDQKPDIAATRLLGNSVSILLNQTSSGSIAFGAPTTLPVVDLPFGLDFGDLDGNGKPDIVITSIGSKSLTILTNTTNSPGNLSFQRSDKPITYISRTIFIGDIDGDAKPDLTYASVDNDNTGELSSKISILRNKACPQPEISPAGPHTICTGFPLKLTTLNNPGTMYEWSDGTTTTPASPNAFFNVTASGNYTVKALAEGGTCALVSNSVTVVVDPGTTTGVAVPTNNGPICIGSPLILTVNDVGGTEYKWTGPNGYTGTTINPSQIPNFQLTNAGRYNLDVIVGTCIAQQVSTVVEAVPVPQFQINSGGSTVVCSPDTKVLTVSPNLPSFSYEWFRRSSATVLSATTSYNATTSGEYYVKAQYTPNPSCATVETAGVVITFATAPVADFTLPSPVCRGQNVTFTNTSSADPSVPVIYAWEFGDTNTSNDVNPVNRYLTATTFTVKLTASYSNGSGSCTDVQTKPLTVQPAPLATITTSQGQFSFCPEGNLVLTVPGPFTSYSWNTNETTSSITVTEAGFYSVDVTTTTGCTVNATQEVAVFESPEVTVEANPSEIKEGQTATLLAAGLMNYVWEPGESLSSTTIADPVASPLVTTVYTVSGTDSNGCTGEAIFELKVTPGSVYDKITPSPFFSPDNGDDFGKFWSVEKIVEFPHCQVSIYDEKGVKVHEAKPYANTWDGTFNGQKLPDGVYYFIIKCDGEQNSPKTGSITLLR
jgi:gliding motility-associated-like protein